MPEANVLYSVTGVVIVGLVAWVAMVLKSAKEPWVRPAPAELPSEEVAPAEAKSETETKSEAETKDPNKLDADDTARATPVALSEGRAKVADKVEDEAPKDEHADLPEEVKKASEA